MEKENNGKGELIDRTLPGYDNFDNTRPPGGTPILGHIRDVRPERVSFSGQNGS